MTQSASPFLAFAYKSGSMTDMHNKILGILIIIFSYSKAWALSDVQISGELDVAASVWNLPTGERGTSTFEIPTLFLELDAPLKEDNLLVVKLEGSEEKDSSVERFDIKAREAYVDVVSLFQGTHGVRFGLIPQTWQEAQYETWSYRFLGKTAWALTEKWKYLNESDLGISFMSELPRNLGEWAVTLSNGEGAQEKEVGPHKEGSLFVRFTPGESGVFALSYVRGNYEKYGAEVGLKERVQALLSYEREQDWLVGLELFWSKDPADALRDHEMAEEVDVTAFTGQVLEGNGGSLFTVIHTGPKAELMLRYDYLNAAVGKDGKDLQTTLAALAYRVTEDLRMAFAIDYTHYGKDFAAGIRDRSKLELAAQVLF